MLLLHVFFYLGILSFPSPFLKPANAEDIPCTVTQDDGQTLYSVPEFQATGCDYQWTNVTNHVIANPWKHCDKQVVMKSDRTLLTYKCSKQVHYIRICISEGMKRMATCTTNCSAVAGIRKEGEITHNHWIATIAVITVVLLLLLLGLLCYKFRDHIQRKLHLYTSVKTQSNVPV